MKPLIGITTSHHIDGALPLPGAYVQSVITAGGVPVILPTTISEGEFAQLRGRLDGILLTGGADLDPACYGGELHTKVYGVDPDRDRLEIGLTRLAVETDWPFLGICRGIQAVNVALGGTLYTHLPDQFPNVLQHDADGPRDQETHVVSIDPGTRLADVLGVAQTGTNTFHHQAILRLAPGLKETAHTSDGLIEGVELPGHRFGLAVQWHPECMPNSVPMQRLFAAFVRAAGEE